VSNPNAGPLGRCRRRGLHTPAEIGFSGTVAFL